MSIFPKGKKLKERILEFKLKELFRYIHIPVPNQHKKEDMKKEDIPLEAIEKTLAQAKVTQKKEENKADEEEKEADGIESFDTATDLIEMSEIEAEALELEPEERISDLEENIEENFEEIKKEIHPQYDASQQAYVEDLSKDYYKEIDNKEGYVRFEEAAGPSEHQKEKTYLETEEIVLDKRGY